MRVFLLNDGGFVGLEAIKFPIEVEGKAMRTRSDGAVFAEIAGSIMVELGGEAFDITWDYSFELGSECQVLSPVGRT